MNSRQIESLVGCKIVDWDVSCNAAGAQELTLIFDDGKSLVFGDLDSLERLEVLDKND